MNTVTQEPEELLTQGDVTFLVMLATLIGILWLTLFYQPDQQRNELVAAVTNQSSQLQVNEWHAAGEISCPTAGMYLVSPQPGEFIEKSAVVPIAGRADLQGLHRYVLQYEHKVDGWTTLDTFRAERGVEPLGNWITSGLITGQYNLRLAILDVAGNPIEDTACVTSVWLVDSVSID